MLTREVDKMILKVDKNKLLSVCTLFVHFVFFALIHMLFTHVGTWTAPIMTGEATGEIFGIVESHRIGYLGDIPVGIILHDQFPGNAQTVVTNELTRTYSRLGIQSFRHQTFCSYPRHRQRQ